MENLKNQIDNEKNLAVKSVGLILQEICNKNHKIAKLIEQDLQNESMSIKKCFDNLHSYAKTHQSNGCWACPVFDITPDNEVIKVIIDFYKIPVEWLEEPKTQTIGQDTSLDLMSLLG